MITDHEIWKSQVSAKVIYKLTDGAIDSVRLRSWMARGLITDSGYVPAPGEPRLYPMSTTYIAAWLAVFERYGVKLHQAQKWIDSWMQELRKQPAQKDWPVFVVFFGRDNPTAKMLTLEEGDRRLVDVLTEFGGHVAVINLMDIRIQIDRRYKKFVEEGKITIVANNVTNSTESMYRQIPEVA